jgi:hypothetical protein
MKIMQQCAICNAAILLQRDKKKVMQYTLLLHVIYRFLVLSTMQCSSLAEMVSQESATHSGCPEHGIIELLGLLLAGSTRQHMAGQNGLA